MKIRNLVAAAGLMIAAMGVSGAAQAQPHRGDRAAVHHDNGRHMGRGDHRRLERNRGHYGRATRHCRTVWRNHRRVRVCR